MTTDMPVYDKDQTIFMLRGIISEAGEGFIYQKHEDPSGTDRCEYVVYDESIGDYKGDCLIGHLLLYLGADDGYLAESGNKTIGTLLLNVEDEDPGAFPFRFTLGAKSILRVAQNCQDEGHSWGKALRTAIADAKGYEA